MKARKYPKVYITEKGEKQILIGHPWVYCGEIVKHDDGIIDGEIVDIISNKEKYLGSGYYNHNSKITIRIISRNANDEFDEAFYQRRIEYAWNYRKMVMANDLNCCRIIYGESDGLPGLTVDKFNDILVVQILSLGIEKNKDIILPLIYKVLTKDGIIINGIYEREDVPIRELEGITEFKGWYDIGLPIPSTTTTQIIENDLKYIVDFENGQKTGFFLDQKYNRLNVRKLAMNHTVLDYCTHTDSFTINTFLSGAKKVVSTDISDKALEDAKNNFKLNNMDIETISGDIFDVLKEISEEKTKTFDFIVLDPLGFTKSRKTIGNALKGYEEINYLAMKCLPRGGFLATASCSHFADYVSFKQAIVNASLKANVSLKEVSYSSASPDHPILVNVPETEYLKF